MKNKLICRFKELENVPYPYRNNMKGYRTKGLSFESNRVLFGLFS